MLLVPRNLPMTMPSISIPNIAATAAMMMLTTELLNSFLMIVPSLCATLDVKLLTLSLICHANSFLMRRMFCPSS